MRSAFTKRDYGHCPRRCCAFIANNLQLRIDTRLRRLSTTAQSGGFLLAIIQCLFSQPPFEIRDGRGAGVPIEITPGALTPVQAHAQQACCQGTCVGLTLGCLLNCSGEGSSLMHSYGTRALGSSCCGCAAARQVLPGLCGNPCEPRRWASLLPCGPWARSRTIFESYLQDETLEKAGRNQHVLLEERVGAPRVDENSE